LRSFQDHLGEFQRRGVQVVAVSVDPPGKTREHFAKLGFTYTFLSDQDRNVIRRYDLLHSSEGDIARPAEFLIDPQGVVRWRLLTPNYYVRLRPEEVLAALDRLAK
jgi:peroxiredoxin